MSSRLHTKWKRHRIRIERLYVACLRLIFGLILLPWRRRKIFASTLGLLVLAMLARYWIKGRQFQARLDQMKANGEFVTVADWELRHAPPAGKADLSSQVTDILKRLTEKERAFTGEQRFRYSFLPAFSGNPNQLISSPPGNDWPLLPSAEECLSHFRDELNEIDSSLARDGFIVSLDWDLPLSEDDRQWTVADLGELIQMDAVVHAHRGNSSAVMRNIRLLHRMQQAMEFDPKPDAQFTRVDLVGQAIDVIELLCCSVGWTDQELESLRTSLASVDVEKIIQRAAQAEVVYGFAKLNEPNELFMPSWRKKYIRATLFPFEFENWYWDIHCQYLACVKDLRQSNLAHRRLDTLEDDLRESLCGRLTWDMDFDTPSIKTKLVFPRAIARVRIASVVLAVEAYRNRNGTWPAQRDDLVPQFLDKIPDDPFSEEPLKYVRKESEYRVYSVGDDGMDDQGSFPGDLSSQTYPIDLLDPLAHAPRAGITWGTMDKVPPHETEPPQKSTFRLDIATRMLDAGGIQVTGSTDLSAGTELLAGVVTLAPSVTGDFYRSGRAAMASGGEFALYGRSLRVSKPTSVDQTGRFQFEPFANLPSGWYALEVAIQDSLSDDARNHLGGLGVSGSYDKSESEPFPAGAGMTLGVGQDHQSVEGRFTVRFPPGRIQKALFRAGFGSTLLHRRDLWMPVEQLASISWAELSPKLMQEMGLEELSNSALQRIEGDNRTIREIRFLDFNARELRASRPWPAEHSSGGWAGLGTQPPDKTAEKKKLDVRAITFLSGSRQYTLAVVSSSDQDGQAMASAVVDSFRLVSEK